jgi:hypothetical protein
VKDLEHIYEPKIYADYTYKNRENHMDCVSSKSRIVNVNMLVACQCLVKYSYLRKSIHDKISYVDSKKVTQVCA